MPSSEDLFSDGENLKNEVCLRVKIDGPDNRSDAFFDPHPEPDVAAERPVEPPVEVAKVAPLVERRVVRVERAVVEHAAPRPVPVRPAPAPEPEIDPERLALILAAEAEREEREREARAAYLARCREETEASLNAVLASLPSEDSPAEASEAPEPPVGTPEAQDAFPGHAGAEKPASVAEDLKWTLSHS
jgi:hypothetical protein